MLAPSEKRMGFVFVISSWQCTLKSPITVHLLIQMLDMWEYCLSPAATEYELVSTLFHLHGCWSLFMFQLILFQEEIIIIADVIRTYELTYSMCNWQLFLTFRKT
jgi:hypothetical protein